MFLSVKFEEVWNIKCDDHHNQDMQSSQNNSFLPSVVSWNGLTYDHLGTPKWSASAWFGVWKVHLRIVVDSIKGELEGKCCIDSPGKICHASFLIWTQLFSPWEELQSSLSLSMAVALFGGALVLTLSIAS